MPSSTAQTQLGRQFWASIRETVDAALWNLPSSRKRLNHIGFGQARFWASRPSAGRFFTSSRHLPSPQSAKFSSTSVRRSCTSGGLLLLGLGNPTSSTQNVVTTCAAAADSAIVAGAASKTNVSRLARQAWQRGQHTGALGKGRTPARRYKSSKAGEEEVKKSAVPPKAENAQKPTTTPPKGQPEHHDPESITESMSKYLSDHLPHLPKMPHRPTKEELLAAATGFWQRMKVRFKWFSIRSMRPWNADEWGAFVSWFVFGHIVWILLGTTTFFSLVILTVNTVFAQEELAKWVGDYLTQSAGVTVVFESAIVPRWKDGVITFRNVFVSRRPGQLKSSVKKGSSTSAAAMAAAKAGHSESATEADDGNYTQFDVTINTVNVTLSFIKWWNGKGFLKDVEVKGVRGVVDRTHVVWPDEPADPLSYRHEHQPGDFEIEHFKLEDLLVTIHQPDNFRPFSMSIYSCELPQLRKQWLFYDFLSATHMSGSFDGSLFTIHPRQIHGVPAGDDHGIIAVDQVGDASAWKKFSRLRIDGLKIDHLNRGVEGPFGWIYEGNLDIVADIMFPADVDEGIGKVVSDFYDKMEEAVTSNRYLRILDNQDQEGPANDAQYALDSGPEQQGHLSRDTASILHSEPQDTSTITTTREQTAEASLSTVPEAAPHASPIDEIPRYLVMDLRLHLNDVRAQVPYFSASKDLGHSYINAALIRPIVAYINSKRTYIPINCRVVKRAPDFDGSWSIFDCGLMDDMSAEVYSAFARDVEDQQSRVRRLKKVGFWTLSMVVHALLAGVAGDYM